MPRSHWIARLLFAGFCLFLLEIVSAANRGMLPLWALRIVHLPLGDKLGHFLLMGGFSFGLNWLAQGATVRRLGRDWLVGSAVAVVVVTLEELSQLFIITRTLSLTDLLADLAGIWLFGRLALWLLRRRQERRQP